MVDRSFLDWPFLTPVHKALHDRLQEWAEVNLQWLRDEHDESEAAVDAAVRRVVVQLGEAGLLGHAVAAPLSGALSVRSLCVSRDVLARHHGLADFAFAMQGLGSGPISLFGSAEQKGRYLPRVAAGRAIAAFALSEAEAGSDVAAMTTRATRDGDGWRIDGGKAWISNAGLADFYVVFARTDDSGGSKGVSAFIVDADTVGLKVVERPPIISPHPVGSLQFEGCKVAHDGLVGQPGRGFGIAMATLDVFRSTVGAAALGFARHALDATVDHASQRRLFGAPLSEMQLTKAALADMALAIDAAALLVYRAAWCKDSIGGRISREASMAKLFATEAAQQVIDSAVQLHGGRGVVRGSIPERLYREIRSLRIYEGASEVQRLIIADRLLEAALH